MFSKLCRSMEMAPSHAKRARRTDSPKQTKQAVEPPPADGSRLTARRAEEKDFIITHDTKTSQVWFLVCSEWLSKWKLFASGKGGLPGPISNYNLVGPDGNPLPGKKAIRDFRGVNPEVWNFWQSRHGGGPEIKRQKLELYVPTARPKLSAWANGPPASTVMAMAKSVVSAPSVPVDPPKPFAQFTQDGNGKNGKDGSGIGRCGKCDGKHATQACPYFKKERDDHPDAYKLLGKKHLVAANEVEEARVITRARVVRQPGDGSCLFHSMAYGLKDGSNAGSLRKEVCDYMQRNANTEIMETPLGEWIKYDSHCSVQEYVSSMRRGAWGGGLEMAVVALQKGVLIDVYESRQGGFARIARFGTRSKAPPINVVYGGRMHYDALQLL